MPPDRTAIRAAIPHLLAASGAIKTAQEAARAQKLVGSSLQSAVVLKLPPQALTIFGEYADELASIFVVSDVRLVETSDEEVAGSEKTEWEFEAEFETLGGRAKALVTAPEGAKCVRCWRYVAPAEETLCTRCEEVVG